MSIALPSAAGAARRRVLRLGLAGALAYVAGGRALALTYPAVEPGRLLRFPADHGAHPDFRSEWWYVTGWLEAADSPLGFQVTFFRNRPGVAEDLPVATAPRQLIFAHVALSDPHERGLLHAQRSARAAWGLAYARESTLDVAIDDWWLRMEDAGRLTTRIEARDFALDLSLTASQALLLEGDSGFSRKGPRPAEASYYYSWPQLRVQGSVDRGARRSAVTGVAWLDHEWSSEYMAPEAAGWDWTGINLDDGGALMAFRMRRRGESVLWAGGTWRQAGGEMRTFAPGEISFKGLRTWRSPRTGVAYPVAMRVEVPGLALDLRPLFDDQELDARSSVGTVYWEGAIEAVSGDRRVGRGYLELTGYLSRLTL